MENSPGLHRTLGLSALIIYGVGDILGAGIYALTGKVAGVAGTHAWLAFLCAMLVASVTALTYAEMVSRHPHSGGAAFFCLKAFRSPSLSLLIGWLVLCSGVVSIAAGSRAFAGYLRSVAPVLPEPLLVLLFVAGVAGIAFWGIRESSIANMICTFIEGSGLMIVLFTGLAWLLSDAAPVEAQPLRAPQEGFSTAAIISGAALAFYAFIGFEDLVNLAEEAKRPERNVPLAVLLAMLITGIVYVAIAAVATHVLPPAALGASKAPLLDVVGVSAPSVPPLLFSFIALFAVANTALLNCVMGSRLLYGLAREGMLPRRLAAVHGATQTPHVALLLVFGAATVLALAGTIEGLAGTTSTLLLAVFACVHIALLVLKKREQDHGGFRIPAPFPALGALLCLTLIFFAQNASLRMGLLLLGVGVAIIAWRRLQTR